jgi:pyruvate formate lyase activating enzyme
MDAVNVDLKGFTEDFYHRICSAHLQPVLDTLLYLHNKTKVWTEITRLLIPGENDSQDEINQMTGWPVEHLGQNVPVTSWHSPRLENTREAADARASTLYRAQSIALHNSIRNAYVGNVSAPAQSGTYCHQCTTLTGREWFDVTTWNLTDDGHCQSGGANVAVS